MVDHFWASLLLVYGVGVLGRCSRSSSLLFEIDQGRPDSRKVRWLNMDTSFPDHCKQTSDSSSSYESTQEPLVLGHRKSHGLSSTRVSVSFPSSGLKPPLPILFPSSTKSIGLLSLQEASLSFQSDS
ncbi:hypothetical protein AUEXF2481DRAFT_184807 [Aureobasidium subglaciale EXF-2481]|uniref:Uncharacterized protein n=1 Tax=Aureobasidium subglaciale (strain EXF-2481) TaxID=1043005 RepID=A0A074YP71_AURSE|nr:uncharacterized protein AUEXF2481DRAFT_184807 [Aureobasidium subglaciale EXF-2481]KEQ99588.1 hypothetical protein AUEXF2481DRAFT_184807 [Aureobasidium subglaciale EXF-2481]